MRSRLLTLVSACFLTLAMAGCYGGDSSPEEAGGGGVPPQGDVSPRTNIGESDGFPEADEY